MVRHEDVERSEFLVKASRIWRGVKESDINAGPHVWINEDREKNPVCEPFGRVVAAFLTNKQEEGFVRYSRNPESTT